MKKILLFLVILFAGVTFATAQNMQVSGKVTYADDGSPVVGATILVKGTGVATLSDINGLYQITVPSSSDKALVVSYAGLVPQEQAVSSAGQVINFVMATDAHSIGEVVVTGYGSPRRAGTVVGSSVKVDATSIEAKPTASVMDALQGRVAGLQVYNSSGDPGTEQSVRLHGVGSLTASSAPLYVVDGVAVDSRTVVAMNANDFESVTVLKDASATSIYGSRAANGVIYISTKRGSYNQKAQITARAQYGISSLANRDFYDQMMTTDQLWGFQEATGMRSPAQIASQQKGLRAAGIVQSDGSFYNTQWVDYMQRNNQPTYNFDLSVQGGGEKVSYYVSGSYRKEEGTAPGSFYERGTLRSNIQAKPTDWMRTGVNVQLSLDNRQTNSQYGTNSTGGGLSFLLQPFYSPHSWDAEKGEYTTPDMMPGMGMANPNYSMEKQPDLYTRYGITGNAFVEFEPVKRLIIRSVVGTTLGLTKNDWKRFPSYLPNLGNGLRGLSDANQSASTLTNTIEYSLDIGEDHYFAVLAGQEGIANRYSYHYIQSSGQTDDRLLNIDNGLQSTYASRSEMFNSNFLSFFGRIDYNYKERYIFDASVRNDASSRFSAANRSATFWSVGAMWNLKNEEFLADNDVVSAATFKVSYGTQGNSQFAANQYRYTNEYAQFSTVGETTMYDQKAAWVMTAPGNADLKWETQTKFTVAANVTLWNKLTVGLEYYNRVTDDMLMNVPQPSSTGFTSVMQNVGSIENNGIDISIDYNVLSHKDYYLNVYANFNYNAMKVTQLFDDRQRWTVSNTGTAYVVGSPVMFYYPLYAGVNPENGNMQWYKPGADIDERTTNNGVTENFDEGALNQNTGKPRYAPMAGGFGLSGGWKGISITADFIYVLDKYLISNDRYFSENPIGFAGYNTSANVLDYWKKPGDVVEYPAWKPGTVMQFDSHLLEDASFLRLKNLTVAYELPSKLFKNSKSMQGAKVYFTGRNLLTVTEFKGIDPEIDSNFGLGNVGNSKQFIFGLELTF